MEENRERPEEIMGKDKIRNDTGMSVKNNGDRKGIKNGRI